MLHGYIIDPETGKKVAVIRHGEVFRDDKEGARIAIVINANLYDLRGNLVGRLDGQHVIDVRTRSMPIAFRNLLEGESAHHPSPLSNKRGGSKAALLVIWQQARGRAQQQRPRGQCGRNWVENVWPPVCKVLPRSAASLLQLIRPRRFPPGQDGEMRAPRSS